MKQLITALIFIGLSGCEIPVSDAALCGETMTDRVAALRAGLEAHPETADAVGDPAVDVVIGHEAGCVK